jgi:hypothetical protein
VVTAWFWPRQEPLAVIPEPHCHDEHEVCARDATQINAGGVAGVVVVVAHEAAELQLCTAE